mgnify:CR=1 FL=1
MDILEEITEQLEEDPLKGVISTPTLVGQQYVQPLTGPRAKFLPVIVANSLSISAGATTLLLSYTVPLGYIFEVLSLSLEAATTQGNSDCQFIVQMDGTRITDASGIPLNLWNIAKENTGFNLLGKERQLIEIYINNTSGSTAHTVNGCLNGRRVSTT